MKSRINDIDLKNWRDYLGDITTNALWISNLKSKLIFNIPKRGFLPSPANNFHGVFIPEIPYQFIKRFTKKGEIVWDCFGGSGTTKMVADILSRKCIINDIRPTADYIIEADSRYFNPGTTVQLIIMHPPYYNTIKYSDNDNDGSACRSIAEFLSWFEEVVENVVKYLDKNRFLILVCGNIYYNGEEHTLGVWCKDIIRKFGFKLKSHIIKDYGETKSGFGGNSYHLNFYRQLKYHYNNFYGDNIFVLRKEV